MRAASGRPAEVSITPVSTTSGDAAPGSSKAQPVPTSPGSTPSTRDGRAAARRSGGGDGFDDLVGNVVVRVDRLDVVQLLQRLDEAQHLWRVLAFDANRRLGHEGDLGSEHGDPRGLQGALTA